MRGRLSCTETATTMQLSAGVVGRFRSVCGRTGDANGATVRGAGQMEFWNGILRHLGIVRCTVLYRLNIESLCNIGRSILGHHKAIGVRCQTNTAPHDAVRCTCVAGRRMHFAATATDSGQRTHDRRWRTIVCCVPEFWLSNLRHIRIILYTVSRNVVRVLSNISCRPANSDGRETGTDPFGKCHKRWYAANENQHTGCGGTDRFAASEKITISISKRAKSIYDVRHHNVSIYRMLATIFYLSYSSSISRRKSSSSTDVVFSIFVVRLCQFAVESNYLCNIESRLSKAISGDSLFSLFELEFNDARGLLSQSIWRATIATRCVGW